MHVCRSTQARARRSPRPRHRTAPALRISPPGTVPAGRPGKRDGGRACKPRCVRIPTITAGSSMEAMGARLPRSGVWRASRPANDLAVRRDCGLAPGVDLFGPQRGHAEAPQPSAEHLRLGRRHAVDPSPPRLVTPATHHNPIRGGRSPVPLPGRARRRRSAGCRVRTDRGEA